MSWLTAKTKHIKSIDSPARARRRKVIYSLLVGFGLVLTVGIWFPAWLDSVLAPYVGVLTPSLLGWLGLEVYEGRKDSEEFNDLND